MKIFAAMFVVLALAACDGKSTTTNTTNECNPEVACAPDQALISVDNVLVCQPPTYCPEGTTQTEQGCLAPVYCPPHRTLGPDGKCHREHRFNHDDESSDD